MPALVEQDVRRLDVAMDETLRVRSVERVRHPREDRQRLLCWSVFRARSSAFRSLPWTKRIARNSCPSCSPAS